MLSIRIVGIPKPQARPRTFFKDWTVRTYSPKSQWFYLIYAEALRHRPEERWDGPLALEATFIFPRPKHGHKNDVWKDTRPDGDNLIKSAMDAISQAQWWADDSRVCDIRVKKRYQNEKEDPGAIINVFKLTE